MDFKIWKLFVIIMIKVEPRMLESANVVVLVGGVDAYEGHVVLLTDPNHASSVCFHTGSVSGLENMARVVCRQFGAFGGHAGPSLQGTRAAFAPSLAISQNGCKGTEPSILDCEHTETATCKDGLNYTVNCSRDPDVHQGIRLVEGIGATDGIVELYFHGKWFRIKGETAGKDGEAEEEEEAELHLFHSKVACRQLGLTGGIGVAVSNMSSRTGVLDTASVSCDSPSYTSLYQCTITPEADCTEPYVYLQCNRSSPENVVEGVLPASYNFQGFLHYDYHLHVSSVDELVVDAQTCSGLKLRFFPTTSSKDSLTEVVIEKLVPSQLKTQIVLRECYHGGSDQCRSSIISRTRTDRLFHCNASNYPPDHPSWVRISLNVRQLINSGLLLISGWPLLPQIDDNLSSRIGSQGVVVDRRNFSVPFRSRPRLLKYLEIASSDHQVAFRVPRDGTVNKCLVTKSELDRDAVQQCGDDYVDEELCTVQCGCCFAAHGLLHSNGPSCFHPIAVPTRPAAKLRPCNRPFATLHGLVVILYNCPCHAYNDAAFIALIQHFNPRLSAVLDPGNGDENQTVAIIENATTAQDEMPDWAAQKLDAVHITGVAAFARGSVTYRYTSAGNYTAKLFLFGSKPDVDVSTFPVSVRITKKRSMRDVVQNVTFLNNGPTRRDHKFSFLVAVSAVSEHLHVTLQRGDFVTSVVTLDQQTPIPDWALDKVGNATILKYRALVEGSYGNPGLYKPALILSDHDYEDCIYRVGSVKVLSSRELTGEVYLLAEGGGAPPSNTITFALIVEKITNSTGATINFGDGSTSARPQLDRFSSDLPSWVATEMSARWKNPFALHGSLTTHMFWSPGVYHVQAKVTYDEGSINDPVTADIALIVSCAVELALTGGERDLANVVTYNKGDNFVIAAGVTLTCARDEVQSVGWNVYFLRQMSGSPFAVTDERPDASNRLDADEVKRMLQRNRSPRQDILFRVPSFTLRYGIYVFEINVTSTRGAQRNASSWVFIRPLDIAVQLSGQVYLRTGLNDSVRFEVISHNDPDERLGSQSSPVAYQWYCVQGIGLLTPELLQNKTGGCFGHGTNLSSEMSHFLAFNTSHLQHRALPQLYTFWVVALKESRSGYDHRFLELLSDVTSPAAAQSSPPELPSDSERHILVEINCVSNCLASLDLVERLTLTAVCRSCLPEEEVVYRWELEPRDAADATVVFNLTEHGVANNGSTLMILPFLLGVFEQVKKVELYQLKVTVTRPNHHRQGDAIYVFAVGVPLDSEEGEPGKMGESRSGAASHLLFSGHKGFVIQLFVSSCLLLLIVVCQSVPLSITYHDEMFIVYLNYSTMLFPCFSVVFFVMLFQCFSPASCLRAGLMFLPFTSCVAVAYIFAVIIATSE